MNQLFKNVKEAVSAKQAAEMYGLKVGGNGIALCPFHPDKNPSMKVDDRYYCFGCGATGDAIDLAGKLLDLSAKEAAQRLAADFHVDIDIPPIIKPIKSCRIRARGDPKKKSKEQKYHVLDILLQYRSLLRYWEERYAPQGMDEDWHSLFCEALQNKSYIDYLLDELMLCSEDQRQESERSCRKELERIEYRLGEFTRRNTKPDQGCKRAS